MIPAFHRQQEQGPRVIDLADGRVLFLPRGQKGGGAAFVVDDYLQGAGLEDRVVWVQRIAAGLAMALIFAAGALERWWLLGFLIPVMVAPRLAESWIVRGLRPATDTNALAEVEPEGRAADVGAVVMLLVAVGWLAFRWHFGPPASSWRRGELALSAISVAALIFQIYTQHRTSEVRRITSTSGDPENKPIVPR